MLRLKSNIFVVWLDNLSVLFSMVYKYTISSSSVNNFFHAPSKKTREQVAFEP